VLTAETISRLMVLMVHSILNVEGKAERCYLEAEVVKACEGVAEQSGGGGRGGGDGVGIFSRVASSTHVSCVAAL